MYSLKTIIKFKSINDFIYTYLISFIFSLWIFQTPTKNWLLVIVVYVINLLLINAIKIFSASISLRTYKPRFYLRNSMTYQQVIEKNTMSSMKDNVIYDDENEYMFRKNFEINRNRIWLTYITTIVFLLLFWSFLLFFNTFNNYLIINWKNLVSFIFFLSAYEMMLTAIEAYDFEKVRYGKARTLVIVRDYSIISVIFISIGLWIIFDPASFSKIYGFLKWIDKLSN